ncbi:hypothetical protein BD311DRAFT_763680 [Dichomitus squalens]|uniref:Uncharacterized protein n=1 Tax=Dichomitus squalens TaxID=114155 RepID=A0A4Q9MEN6_9APHY|nr:hypothetical protein BD311DRAFT_763680 [Dichomitus squalens]
MPPVELSGKANIPGEWEGRGRLRRRHIGAKAFGVGGRIWQELRRGLLRLTGVYVRAWRTGGHVAMEIRMLRGYSRGAGCALVSQRRGHTCAVFRPRMSDAPTRRVQKIRREDRGDSYEQAPLAESGDAKLSGSLRRAWCVGCSASGDARCTIHVGRTEIAAAVRREGACEEVLEKNVDHAYVPAEEHMRKGSTTCRGETRPGLAAGAGVTGCIVRSKAPGEGVRLNTI